MDVGEVIGQQSFHQVAAALESSHFWLGVSLDF